MQTLFERVRLGLPVSDDEFDQIFPLESRRVSKEQWTPIRVAQQIAAWLNPLPQKNFIDIGCGVGKLCFLLKLLTDLNVTGIEQREGLVKVARQVASDAGLAIELRHLNMLDLDWSAFNVFYLYNPFHEHLSFGPFGSIKALDKAIERDPKLFVQYTDCVIERMDALAVGSLLITFHGFGGKVPPGWSVREKTKIEGGALVLWEKREMMEKKNDPFALFEES